MTAAPFRSPSVGEEMRQPAAPGAAHRQMVKAAASGMISAQSRPNRADDIPDSEIRKIGSWADSRIHSRKSPFPLSIPKRPFSHPKPSNRRNSVSVIDRFLGGFRCGEADVWEASPIRLPDDFRTDSIYLIRFLFRPDECINVVTEFGMVGGKPHPKGFGTTLKRDQWLAEFSRNGPPTGKAGAWIRPNPTDGNGIADANTARFRHLLVDFDSVPIGRQLPFLARIRLPISAILTNGGKSLHAWVAVNAESKDQFQEFASTVYRTLAPYGIKTANRNPSRLSRLPGTVREIGGGTDNRQRMLYLNPNPGWEAILP